MVDFKEFDEKVDLNALQKEVEESDDSGFTEVPDGTYVAGIEKMELTVTKTEKKPMFAVQMKIKEGAQKGRMIFFNRVVGGNRNTERWNDGKAIKSVITWVNKLLTADDEPVDFVNYSDFAEQILDVFQLVQGHIELDVEYKKDAFNPITIQEVYEL